MSAVVTYIARITQVTFKATNKTMSDFFVPFYRFINNFGENIKSIN